MFSAGKAITLSRDYSHSIPKPNNTRARSGLYFSSAMVHNGLTSHSMNTCFGEVRNDLQTIPRTLALERWEFLFSLKVKTLSLWYLERKVTALENLARLCLLIITPDTISLLLWVFILPWESYTWKLGKGRPVSTYFIYSFLILSGTGLRD